MNVRLVEGRISNLFRSIENVAASNQAVFEQDLKILSERIKLLLAAFKLFAELLKTSLHFFLVHGARIAALWQVFNVFLTFAPRVRLPINDTKWPKRFWQKRPLKARKPER